MVGIYKITNKINGKIYIGQARDIANRWVRHKYELKHNCHVNKHLQSSWNKYGSANFEFSVVEECLAENLNNKEMYYINLFDSFNNG